MSEFKPIESQEQLDAVIGERIERAKRKAAEEVHADYDKVKAANASLEQQVADLTKQLKETDGALAGSKTTVEELTAKVKSYEVASVKTKIAHELGIPYQLADKLTGDDEEAIREDAKRMAEFVRKPAAPIGGAEPVSDKKSDPVKTGLAGMAQLIGKETC